MDRATVKPRSRSLAAVTSVLAFGLSIVLLSLLMSLAVLPWLDLSWWKIFRRCVSIAAVLSLWIFIRKMQRRSFSSYGLIAPREGKRDLIFGVLLGAGALGVMLVVGLASGACRINVIPDSARLWRTVVTFVPAAFLVGVLEELVFRGFILQQLLSYSPRLGLIGSSGLYAAVHLKNLAATPAMWLELGGLFLLGILLAYTYLSTRNLWLAIGLHAALAYGARINKLVLAFPDPFSWLTGTSRLVNGLAGWIALLGIGGVVWWWTGRSQRGGAQHGKP